MKKFILISAFLISILFIESCNNYSKDLKKEVLPQQNTLSNKVLGWEQYVKTNPSNNLDSIGRIHNDGIIYYLNNLNQNSKRDDYKFHTQNFICQNTSLPNCDEIASKSINEVVPKIFLTGYTRTFVSTQVNNYFEQLISTIKTDTLQMDIKILQENILEWESIIIKDVSLSTSDRNALLLSGAVARYSSSYWYHQYILRENSAWSNLNFATAKRRCGFWCQLGKVISIISADVIGAFEGAAAGAPYGPYGGIIGGAAGAIAGSVGMGTQLY